MSAADVLDSLARHVITPVVRESDASRARFVSRALRRGGFSVFEITLSVPGALDVIRELAEEPEVTVGVGTVFTADDARAAIRAGARFVVSPAAVPEVAHATREAGAAAILGALTPTEVLAARQAGADAVKIFPVASVGGPAHVKALRSVFPDLPLIPTGGVDEDDLLAHLEAGAHSVGVGSALTGARDAERLEEAARDYLQRAGALRTREPKENP